MFGFEESGVKRIVEAVRWSEGFSRTREGSPFEVPSNHSTRWLECQSQATSDAPGYAVARVVDVTTMNDSPQLMLLVDQPSTTFSRLYVVISPDGLKAGGFGRCSFGPQVDFLFDSGTPLNGDGFGPKPGQWSATKHYPCPLSVSGLFNATKYIARGVLSQIDALIGVTNGAIAKGSSGTVKIYGGDGAGTDTGMTVTVINLFGDVDDATTVALNWINGQWFLIAAAC